MKSRLWICLATMMLALAAAACSEESNPSDASKTCDPACGDGQVCNEFTGQCVGCLDNADCQAPTSFCRLSDNVCVGCLDAGDCIMGYTCDANTSTCVAQEAEAECSETKPCPGDAECVSGHCAERVGCTEENEAERCPGSECTSEGICLNTREVGCRDASPDNAVSVNAQVTITWTLESGWSTADACAWVCKAGFVETSDGKGCELEVKPDCTAATEATDCPNGGECTSENVCLTSKTVNCTDAAPANAQSLVQQTTITWTATSGWSSAATCTWDCVSGYQKTSDGKGCELEVKPDCTAATEATDCPNGGECTSEGVCLTSKKVDCAPVNVANATNSSQKVDITWTAEGGWSEPASCGWSCNAGYKQEGNLCVELCKQGTCSDNVYCTDDKGSEESCGNAQACVPNSGCQTKTCTATSGCTATYETCNTNANNGLGECVAASCSAGACSGDYACVSGKWTACAHGCADNACKPAPTGCAIETNPDEYCFEQAAANNTLDLVCRVSDGVCVECILDENAAHDTCTAAQECVNNKCVDKCGNGTLDSGEQCDPNLPSTQWAQYYRSCEDMSGGAQVGTVKCNPDDCTVSSDCTICGNGKLDEGEECDPSVDSSQWVYPNCADFDPDTSGILTCEAKINESSGAKLCEINTDQCVQGPCYGLTADEACTSYQGGPQPCGVYFEDFTASINQEASIVCKAASETCTTKLVIDSDATTVACVPVEQPTVAVDWCRNQSNNGSYALELNGTTTSLDFYGQVNVDGVTGTNGTGSSNLKGEFVYWDEDGKNMKSIVATETTLDASAGGAVNDQWVANVSTADFAADGRYSYSWRFTADNGVSWYYCRNENHQTGTGTGAATSSASDVINEENLIEVTKPATQSYTENFANMTNSESCSTNAQPAYSHEETFVGANSLNWSYKGFACAAYYTSDESSKGVGIGQKTTNANHVTVSGLTSGIGLLSVKYKFKSTSHTGTIQVFLDDSATPSGSASIKASEQDAASGFGQASIEVNSATATKMKIAPAYKSSNDSFLISEITWHSYP